MTKQFHSLIGGGHISAVRAGILVRLVCCVLAPRIVSGNLVGT